MRVKINVSSHINQSDCFFLAMNNIFAWNEIMIGPPIFTRPATRNVSPGILMNAAENKTDILSHLGYNNRPRLSATVLRVDVKFRSEIGPSGDLVFSKGTLNLRYLSRLLRDCTVTQIRYSVIIDSFENNNGHFERVNLLGEGVMASNILYKYNRHVKVAQGRIVIESRINISWRNFNRMGKGQSSGNAFLISCLL